MADSNMPRAIIPNVPTTFSALWIGLATVLVIVGMAIVREQFGDIGPDSDDVMRLIQIQDFLGLNGGTGQNWFDTNQYRLGPFDGTDMHWSRIPDIPILCLTAIFDIFTNTENALRLAYSVWPPLSSLILIFALAKGTMFWVEGNQLISTELNARPNKTYVFMIVLLVIFVVNFFRFSPGAIDHHNVQLGLVAIAMAYALDPKSRFISFFLSGLAVAISLAIGVEVYIFAGIICVFMALNWLVRGRVAALGTQGFGLGLSGGLGLAFIGTIAPSEYGIIVCDSLSLITLSMGGVGGLGLAMLERFLPDGGYETRIIGLCVLGVVCLLVLSQQAPQCLANPLSVLSDDLDRLWLSQISEAEPISLSTNNAMTEIPYMLGPPVLALGILCFHFWRSPQWSSRILVLMLLLGALGLTFYQQRFYPFAYVIAILPLAGFVSRVYQRSAEAVASHKGEGRAPSNIAYIGALALSVPLLWAAPGLLLQGDNETAMQTKSVGCYSDDVMAELNALPVGLIAATSNGGAPILQFTEHRALSGNYHRNIAGITAQIKIATSAPRESLNLLLQNNVDYVHFCSSSAETENLIKENSDGLYSVLAAGRVPAGLIPVVLDIGDEGPVSIYRVTK